jgi:hypothetical protein
MPDIIVGAGNDDAPVGRQKHTSIEVSDPISHRAAPSTSRSTPAVTAALRMSGLTAGSILLSAFGRN